MTMKKTNFFTVFSFVCVIYSKIMLKLIGRSIFLFLFFLNFSILTYSQKDIISDWSERYNLNIKSSFPVVNWATDFDPIQDTGTIIGFFGIGPFNTQGSLWQIGVPNKPHPLDTTVSPPFALLTDTVNPYPINCNSSFEIHFGRDPGYEYACWSDMIFSMRYRVDADSLRDGFYTEIMYNGNGQWRNVIFDDMADIIDNNPLNTYYPSDTLYNGISGVSYQNPLTVYQGWSFFQISWHWNNVNAHVVDSVAIRVTFVSDNINTNKGGVLIDYLGFFAWDMCNAEIYKDSIINTINIFPNPLTNESIIVFPVEGKYEVTIVDITGKIIFQDSFCDKEYNIGSIGLLPGLYIFSLSGESNFLNGKFIVKP